jgi:YgiT-type zinc finger domain-containing protein
MKNFMVRMNCEYSVVVAAEDEAQAIDIAMKVDCNEEHWSGAWSTPEAEETSDAAELTADMIKSNALPEKYCSNCGSPLERAENTKIPFEFKSMSLTTHLEAFYCPKCKQLVMERV